MTDRADYIRKVFAALADEMIEKGASESGKLEIHFQNGVPRKRKWDMTAETIGVTHMERTR